MRPKWSNLWKKSQLHSGRDRRLVPDVKPLVGLFVQNVVFVTKFLGGNPLLQRLSLGSGSVFIGTTDV